MPIVDHFGTCCVMIAVEPDNAVLRVAMADHVGHSLAHCPCEHRVRDSWKLKLGVFQRTRDTRCFKQLPGAVHFIGQSGLPKASNSLAYLTQSLAGYTLNLTDFLRRTRRLLLDQAPGQLALKSDERQGMPK